MRRHLIPMICIVLALMLVGCGGGSSTSATARATFTVQWRERSRLIPEASNSIRVLVKKGGTVTTSSLLSRPAQGGTSSVTFSELPIGSLTLTATAYPQTDGTGTAQATATIPLVTQAGQSTTFTLTMNTLVDHIQVTPLNVSVATGGTVQLTATAKDVVENSVLTSPLQWVSSNTTIATVDQTGKVTGVSFGTVNIMVTDTETGKTTAVAVTVLSNAYAFSIATGHWYTAVLLDHLITWTDAKESAAVMRYNGWTGHLVTITSAPENQFIQTNFPGTTEQNYWLGGFQDQNAPDYSEPAGGWRWITGEPWQYTDWNEGEPNNSDPASIYLNKFANGTWNDTINTDGHQYGYIVEFEP